MRDDYKRGFEDGRQGNAAQSEGKVYQMGYTDGLYYVLKPYFCNDLLVDTHTETRHEFIRRLNHPRSEVLWDILAAVLFGVALILFCFI